ncbi:MAG TPA: ABC transporter substrate-binding protein [Candidatus Dormibacteraeota bacterium]|nr:ABC transporter substrate-binding protein [Candidatus Dormibacteraeota bacterium]
MRTKSRLNVAVVGLFAAVYATGCGSSNTTSSGSSGSSASKGTWHLGSIVSLSGTAASTYAGGGAEIQAWAQWVNGHGGINGYDVDVDVEDDQSTPAGGLHAAQVLVNKHVLAIVSPGSVSGASWITTVTNAGIPVLGGAALGAQTGNPFPDYYETTATQTAAHGGSFVQFKAAAKEGGTKIGIAYCVELPVCQQALPLFASVAKAVGLTVVSQQGVSATAASYAAPCLAMKNAGADVFEPDITQAVVPLFLQACKAQGWSPIVTASTFQPYWATDPIYNHFAGSTAAFPWFEDTPAANTYRAAMTKYYPQALTTTLNLGPVLWTGGLLFQKAAENAKLGNNPTPAQLVAALDKLSNETLGGATVPLTFTNGNRNIDCAFAISADGGKFVTPLGTNPICS